MKDPILWIYDKKNVMPQHTWLMILLLTGLEGNYWADSSSGSGFGIFHLKLNVLVAFVWVILSVLGIIYVIGDGLGLIIVVYVWLMTRL